MLRIMFCLVILGCGTSDPVRALEERLYAPCCKRQALHDHESPLANQLRAEIRLRIASGESSEAIEQDLVRRYGDEIQVVPASMTLGVAGLFVGLVGAIVMVQFVRRRRTSILTTADAEEPDPDLEDQLDDELSKLD